ncbi:hypothetical protein [Bradyrhizobium sp. UNPA324]|uniref:hypothetical protein n=1 Tax=Bradyrhizobium sp. UNPA324 TaxID=1141174 RepID=UPI0015EEC6AC|nr:hypothetical protein [Bradyrhizobium sp. UNPA324]
MARPANPALVQGNAAIATLQIKYDNFGLLILRHQISTGGGTADSLLSRQTAGTCKFVELFILTFNFWSDNIKFNLEPVGGPDNVPGTAGICGIAC